MSSERERERGNALSRTIWWMMPLPGPQNSMPYFFDALSRKSNTSWLLMIERCGSREAVSACWKGQPDLPNDSTSRGREEAPPPHLEVSLCALVRRDEVVAVDRDGHSGRLPAAGRELEDGHLCRGICGSIPLVSVSEPFPRARACALGEQRSAPCRATRSGRSLRCFSPRMGSPPASPSSTSTKCE